MAIDLRDPRKATFGTTEWQDIMRHNLIEKIKHNEEFGPMEKCFLEVQHEHNYRICKAKLEK